MKLSALRFAVLLAFVACFSVGEASANTITVNKPSFEILPVGGLTNAECLVIGGSTLIAATGTPAAAGDWATYTATFTGTSLTAGQSIGIQLSSIGSQADFDNVQLSDNVGSSILQAVPEPGSISLLALGLSGLAGVARRKFRS